ncbi:phosphoribosylglycinamide formyltransferase [Propionicicella superfundia]|uniref:phosphoribosylglycinamide formyltransferase n=1 Tax=Propionicicella superfundia TaxID=348582 RepID=UPI00041A1006|nr:phosphoribosylglycinamide formyltransferase [Propionicicella superfundia]
MAKRVVVLVSGSGTLLQAIIDAVAEGRLDIDLVAVGSDRPDAHGLARARAAGVDTFVVELAKGADRAAWDRELRDAVAAHDPDLVVGAGFLRIVGPAFLERFGGRMINSHPALLPSFPGVHGVRDALAHGVKVSGTTIFWVDAGVDTGAIIAQHAVPVLPGDTEDDLTERIKEVERPLLVATIADLTRTPERNP